MANFEKLFSENGGPAYPITVDLGMNGTGYHYGMTLRDWFAGQALSGVTPFYSDPLFLAESCYSIADAMIAARNNNTENK